MLCGGVTGGCQLGLSASPHPGYGLSEAEADNGEAQGAGASSPSEAPDGPGVCRVVGESGGTRVRKQLRPWQATLHHMHPSFPSGAQSPPASMVQRGGAHRLQGT